MIQYVLERHGVEIDYNSPRTAAIQICAQKNTITYHTVHSFLNGAGFAKVNLTPENWRSPESADIYIGEMKPVFLSGDPFSFMEYIRLGISYKPEAILTTALHLESALRKKFEDHFACPVIDMYSLNETGPVAYSCPEDPSKFHILPHDLFVEIISPDGKQIPRGSAGDIAVSGGRNPYLPLLRYITGDTASMHYGECKCGESTPALKGLQGRPMVLFRTASGGIINSIDIAGIIREYPVYFFKFTQKKDFSCSLSISAGSDFTFNRESDLKKRIGMLFDDETVILIDRDFKNGEEKNIPFVSEMQLL
jgi:phenylacetate-CoA ligase